MANQFLSQISLGTQAVLIYTGNGSPEGAETAPVGSIYLNATASNAANTLYVKGSGVGDTGWALLAASTIPAGGDTEIQFNDAGVSAGDPQLTWNKTTNTITVGSTNNAGTILVKDQGEIRFEEDNPNGTNYVSLKAPSTLSSNISFTLPNSFPVDNSGFLTANSSGVLGFAVTSRLLYNETTGGIELINAGDNADFFVVKDSTTSPVFSVGYETSVGDTIPKFYRDMLMNNSSRIFALSTGGNPTEVFTLFSDDTFYFGPYDINSNLNGIEMQIRYGRGNVGADSAIALSGIDYYISIPLRAILVPPARNSATNPNLLNINASLATHTATVAGDLNDIRFNLSRNVQFSTGSTISAVRSVYIIPPSYTATSATQTITTASTLAISGPPTAGTNTAITNPLSLNVESGRARFSQIEFHDSGNSSFYLSYGNIAGYASALDRGIILNWTTQRSYIGMNTVSGDFAASSRAWIGATADNVLSMGVGGYQGLTFNGMGESFALSSTTGSGTMGGAWTFLGARSYGDVLGVPISVRRGLESGATGTPDIFRAGTNAATYLFRVLYNGDLLFTPEARTTGSPTLLSLTGPSHTTLTASTEATDINFNLARTVQFATGALTTQRAMRVQAPTYGFVGSSTITTAATVSISGAPVAGTNATITNSYALNIESGKLQTAATTTTTAGFNLPHGTAPTSPINGDLWTTTAGLYARINGATVGPYGTGGGGGTPGGSDTQIQYNSSGSFAGSADLTWDVSSTNRLRINHPSNAGIALFEGGSAKWTIATYSSGTFTFYNDALAEESIGITSANIITMKRKVGVDISPTAYFHVRAGTASANTAPIKLTSGTNLTSIEAGVFEYDGSALYFSPTSSIRHAVTPVESSPTTITSDQNNYSIGNASLIRLTSDAPGRSITGIAGGYPGRRITLRNVNASHHITLTNQSLSSSAANRFVLQGAVIKTLFAGQIVTFFYDSITQRWIEEYDFTIANTYRDTFFTGGVTIYDSNFQILSVLNEYSVFFNTDLITANGGSVTVRMPDDSTASYDMTLLGYPTSVGPLGTEYLPFAASTDGQVEWRTISSFDLPTNIAYLDVAQTFTASQVFRSTNSSSVSVIARGSVSQTANLQEWQTSTPTTVASVSSTGLFAASLGSNTTASYSMLGDPNTGMYSSGADILDFTTGGTNRLRIDASGNLVVNSGTAAGKISVSHATTSMGISFAAGSAVWGIWLGAESVPYFYIGGSGGTSQYFWRANWNDTADASNTFKSASDTNAQNVMEVRGTASQTGRLQQWTRNGTLVSNINSHGDWTFNPAVRTTGSPTLFTVTGPAHTTLTASTEVTDINFNLARVMQFSAGALATQRAIRISAPTYSFVSSSTITDASTVSISGAPVAGTNATITRSYALSIESGAIALRNEGGLHMFESSGLGTNRIVFKAAADLASDSTYSWPILPISVPTGAARNILTSNGSSLSWVVLTNAQLADRIYNEVPSGTVNGSNADFTLVNTPETGTLRVYKNGLRQKPGSGFDYTLSGAVITFESGNIPQTGDVILADYVNGDTIS